jgi:hypothetical protein
MVGGEIAEDQWEIKDDETVWDDANLFNGK